MSSRAKLERLLNRPLSERGYKAAGGNLVTLTDQTGFECLKFDKPDTGSVAARFFVNIPASQVGSAATTFKVQVSDDDETWTDVLCKDEAGVDHGGVSVSVAEGAVETFVMPYDSAHAHHCCARWIRLLGTLNSDPAADLPVGKLIEVYGCVH